MKNNLKPLDYFISLEPLEQIEYFENLSSYFALRHYLLLFRPFVNHPDEVQVLINFISPAKSVHLS